MNVRAVERQSIEASLRRAMERQEFAVHYQPKINLRTGAISGAEALLRWTHPQRGPVSPADFIPVAEDCGLIVPIGRWVLREACRQTQAWVQAGLPIPSIAVNISAMEFSASQFLQGVTAILQETGLDPATLELELTESVLMKHLAASECSLKALRTAGVQLAIDDFGTGYSSLSYLAKFPVDAIKIDQSFIRQITTAPDATALVTAIISMGRSLQLRVVAEGVETLQRTGVSEGPPVRRGPGLLFRPADASRAVRGAVPGRVAHRRPADVVRPLAARAGRRPAAARQNATSSAPQFSMIRTMKTSLGTTVIGVTVFGLLGRRRCRRRNIRTRFRGKG